LIGSRIPYPLRKAHVVECLVDWVGRRDQLNDGAVETEIRDVGRILDDVSLEFGEAGFEPPLHFDLPLAVWYAKADVVGKAVPGEESVAARLVYRGICCRPYKSVV
jgi:hypothetical protein